MDSSPLNKTTVKVQTVLNNFNRLNRLSIQEVKQKVLYYQNCNGLLIGSRMFNAGNGLPVLKAATVNKSRIILCRSRNALTRG